MHAAWRVCPHGGRMRGSLISLDSRQIAHKGSSGSGSGRGRFRPLTSGLSPGWFAAPDEAEEVPRGAAAVAPEVGVATPEFRRASHSATIATATAVGVVAVAPGFADAEVWGGLAHSSASAADIAAAAAAAGVAGAAPGGALATIAPARCAFAR
jgi:hypothetical protein